MSTLIDKGKRPEELIDPNTMTDYGKMKRLIEIDQMDSKRLNIIHGIAENGFLYAHLVSHFPAERILEFSNFVSLLYYYGMLTIGGVRGASLKLIIPNNNVRMQYYQYCWMSIKRSMPCRFLICKQPMTVQPLTATGAR